MRILLWVVVLGGCASESVERQCSNDPGCLQDGAGGLCLPSTAGAGNKWCAFPASSCPSGFKWGLLSGDGLAQTCLPAADAGRGSSLASLSAEPSTVNFDPVV